MFGGAMNPFDQTSKISPFSSPSAFGQTSANPFSQPFGSPTSTSSPFGGQSGGSGFSTGVFGQTPSPLSTTNAFGASSSPAFGASSTPAFGASSPFGQKPSFGGFGSTPAQSNPFGGSTFQQSQPAFGSTPFGSTSTFGASSQPAFGGTSTPAFGSTNTPAFGASTPVFGATSTSAFGATSTPGFGATTTPTFGSTAFGNTGSAFGLSSTPAFGATSSSLFGSSSTPAFGASSTPAFGASSTSSFGFGSSPAFGQSSPAFGQSAPAFGQSALAFGQSAPAFGQSAPAFGQTAPAFGQSTPAFGQSTPAFGTTSFGAQSSLFGGQTSTPAFGSTGFGQSAFGGQRSGSRVVPYAPTVDPDGGTGSQPAGKLDSITAMPAYKDKSHEELRWEDYQQGDKGGPNPAGQPAAGIGFSTQSQTNPFGSTNTFGQSSVPATTSTFSSSGGIFGQKASTFGSSSSAPAFSSPFGSTSSSPFGSTSAAPLFGSSTGSAFGASSSPLFGTTTNSVFGASTPFGSSSASASTPAFGSGLAFGNTQSAGLFQSSPATAQSPSIFGQQSASAFGQSTTPAFGSSLFGTQATGFGGGLFGSSTSQGQPAASAGFGQSTPSFSTPFQAGTLAQSSNGFSFGNFGQTQSAPLSSFGGISNTFGQNTSVQPGANQTNLVMQPALIANPFGTLPVMPQMSFASTVSEAPRQTGISSIPIFEKPPTVRISSLLTPRHLYLKKVKLPSRMFMPKDDRLRVPFFYQDEEAPSTPKANALFIPRENPRALIIQSNGQSCQRNGNITTKISASAPPINSIENGNITKHNSHDEQIDRPSSSKSSQNGKNGFHLDLSDRVVEEEINNDNHVTDIESILPKLRHPEYYTEPCVQELAAKERAELGFCRRVSNFVVGRHGHGHIKFEGVTDVRRLDLDSLIQFNDREVIVYKDESKKPPIGQGLNKPAEVTLLKVICINKKTGQKITDGPRIEKYRNLLNKKATEQGAEFISFDPIKGEWKFKVRHFSKYEFKDEETDR